MMEPQHGRPRQARSRETYGKILTAALDILGTEGLEKFNTNLVAERAGVPVATIYRYFPDKISIMATLADQAVAEWNHWFDAAEALIAPGQDFLPIWEDLIDTYVAGVKAMPAGTALRRAMHAVPELRRIDLRDNQALSGRLGRVFECLYPEIPPESLHRIAAILLETAVACIDLSLESSTEEAAALIAELKTLHRGYLTQKLLG
ncbi:MAG: hypothetical protein FD135_270 [Comamonadaceae bacterium]|nr:MAG: hypothetical protein FD135_270 [Comamonadaceae bacterium]